MLDVEHAELAELAHEVRQYGAFGVEVHRPLPAECEPHMGRRLVERDDRSAGDIVDDRPATEDDRHRAGGHGCFAVDHLDIERRHDAGRDSLDDGCGCRSGRTGGHMHAPGRGRQPRQGHDGIPPITPGIHRLLHERNHDIGRMEVADHDIAGGVTGSCEDDDERTVGRFLHQLGEP